MGTIKSYTKNSYGLPCLSNMMAFAVRSGCCEENILCDALTAFIETDQHLDLIPVIASRLPESQFSDEYWHKNSSLGWTPMFAAVMACAGSEIFAMLSRLGYSLEPVRDLLIHPNPEEFIRILKLAADETADDYSLYENIAGRLLHCCMTKCLDEDIPSGESLYGEACRPYFSFPKGRTVSVQTFDLMLNELIKYGLEHFTSDILALRPQALVQLLCLNPGLTVCAETFLSAVSTSAAFSLEKDSFASLLGAAIWAGNRKMYDFLSGLMPEDRKDVFSRVRIRICGRADYGNGFLEELLASGPLSSDQILFHSVYETLASSPFNCLPSAGMLRRLLASLRNDEYSYSVCSLSTALIRNSWFDFSRDGDLLKLISSMLPDDLEKEDSFGRNSAFYSVSSPDAMRYIAEIKPSVLWKRDHEGCNIFHQFFKQIECNKNLPFKSVLQNFIDLSRILPPALLRQTDKYGKRPSDYFHNPELFRELICEK